MSIGKRRIYLNSPCVTLECAINVLHLLQSVSHVTVCVGKRWLDPTKIISKEHF